MENILVLLITQDWAAKASLSSKPGQCPAGASPHSAAPRESPIGPHTKDGWRHACSQKLPAKRASGVAIGFLIAASLRENQRACTIAGLRAAARP